MNTLTIESPSTLIQYSELLYIITMIYSILSYIMISSILNIYILEYNEYTCY